MGEETTEREEEKVKEATVREGWAVICKSRLDALIYGVNLDAMIYGVDPVPRKMPRSRHAGLWQGPRRRGLWRRAVLPQRHGSWRRPPGFKTGFLSSRSPNVNFL